MKSEGYLRRFKKDLGVDPDKEMKIIPLGADCSISHLLREEGLRLDAFPFDWSVTPLNSALALLENQGQGFLADENLAFLEVDNRLLFDDSQDGLIVSKELITPVICKRYQMLFPHDFSETGRDDLKSVQGKYHRRISRMISVLNSDKQILFVFSDFTLNKWQESQYLQVFEDLPMGSNEDFKSQLCSVMLRGYPDTEYSVLRLDELSGILSKLKSWKSRFGF